MMIMQMYKNEITRDQKKELRFLIQCPRHLRKNIMRKSDPDYDKLLKGKKFNVCEEKHELLTNLLSL